MKCHRDSDRDADLQKTERVRWTRTASPVWWSHHGDSICFSHAVHISSVYDKVNIFSFAPQVGKDIKSLC